MTTLQFADTHNLVAFLAKPTESEGFEQVVDFLNASSIRYALTVNPTIYTSCIEQLWSSVKVKMVNGEQQLQVLVDRKKIIITEATVRRDLQLEDADGIDCLPNATIFELLTLMGQGNDFSSRVTPLFSTMMVQAQQEHGEGSNMPTDPHHTPTIIPPSTSQPQMKQRPVKLKRKDTEIPQSSVPMENVADKVVYEERDDSLERATTTATSLEAEQDRGNISKTQSKVTHNEPSSIGTSSVGGPRRQDTMGDTIAQTRSDNVSKFSNDPLLVGVDIPQSGKDSMQLKELMEFCTKLQQRVLDLENTKTAQAQEIAILKKRVKKLERKKKSRTHGLKRLYNVGLSSRIDSSDDEASLDITLENVHDADIFGVHDLDGDEVFVETKEPMVNVATTTCTIPVSVAKDLSDVDMTLAQALAELKSTKPKAVTTAATTTTTAITRPKAKGLVIQEQEQASTPITSSKDKGKGIMVEEPLKMKKKDQVLFDEQEAIRLQAQFDEEERIAREKEEANAALIAQWNDIQDKVETDYELAQRLQAEEQEELTIEEKSKLFQQLLEKRRKHFAAKRAEERRNRPPTKAQQRSIMCTYLKNMAGWKPKDLKTKSFANVQELFDKAMKRVNTFVDMDTELVGGSEVREEGSETREESSSKRAGDELEQEPSKKQKMEDDKETAELQSMMEVIPDEEEVAVDAIPLATKPPSIVDWKIIKEGKIGYYQIIRADGNSKRYSSMIQMLKSFDREDLETLWKLVKAKHGYTRPEMRILIGFQDMHIFMLVEKRYPLTPATITEMLNRKLQTDHCNEMCYQLLKLMTKQLKKQ
ncbi:hypothetical protein Tco_0007933 [Tanacetum coccineum]